MSSAVLIVFAVDFPIISLLFPLGKMWRDPEYLEENHLTQKDAESRIKTPKCICNRDFNCPNDAVNFR